MGAKIVSEGGEVVIKSLEALGVNHVFGIPGIHSLPVYEALRTSKIKHILARNEQGAAFMADAYGRVTGRPGIVLTTGGPGVMNAFTGIATAFNDHSPVLLITSHLPRAYVRENRGSLHELPAQINFFKEICVFAEAVSDIDEIPKLLAGAWHTAKRLSGPAYVEIPTDILYGRSDSEVDMYLEKEEFGSNDDILIEKRIGGKLLPQPNMNELINMLSGAKAPVIWAGSGVVNAGACNKLEELAGEINCPVITGSGGRGVISEAHRLSLGRFATDPSVQCLLKEADLLLAVGVRFSEYSTLAWKLQLPPNIIRIDIDHGVHDCSVYPSNFALTGDAGIILKQILLQLNNPLLSDSSKLDWAEPWQVRVSQVRNELKDKTDNSQIPEIKVLREIRRILEPDAILCVDLTSLGYWAGQYFPIYQPRTFLYAQGFGPLGFALPAGIASKIACPKQQVVVLSGDGGFMFTCQELAAAAENELDLVIVLVNDNCFGYLKNIQEARYGRGCDYSVSLVNPDFSLLAKSFGIGVIEADGLDILPAAVEKALSQKGTTLVHVRSSVNPPE